LLRSIPPSVNAMARATKDRPHHVLVPSKAKDRNEPPPPGRSPLLGDLKRQCCACTHVDVTVFLDVNLVNCGRLAIEPSDLHLQMCHLLGQLGDF